MCFTKILPKPPIPFTSYGITPHQLSGRILTGVLCGGAQESPGGQPEEHLPSGGPRAAAAAAAGVGRAAVRSERLQHPGAGQPGARRGRRSGHAWRGGTLKATQLRRAGKRLRPDETQRGEERRAEGARRNKKAASREEKP